MDKNKCPYQINNCVGQCLCELASDYGMFNKTCGQIDDDMCNRMIAEKLKEQNEH